MTPPRPPLKTLAAIAASEAIYEANMTDCAIVRWDDLHAWGRKIAAEAYRLGFHDAQRKKKR